MLVCSFNYTIIHVYTDLKFQNTLVISYSECPLHDHIIMFAFSFFHAVLLKIVQFPSVKDIYDINEPGSFTVHFFSTKVNTSVIWLHDNLPLYPSITNIKIITMFPSVDGTSPANTSLQFTRLTPANVGNYTLLIFNNITAAPLPNRTTTIEFKVVLYSTL